MSEPNERDEEKEAEEFRKHPYDEEPNPRPSYPAGVWKYAWTRSLKFGDWLAWLFRPCRVIRMAQFGTFAAIYYEDNGKIDMKYYKPVEGVGK